MSPRVYGIMVLCCVLGLAGCGFLSDSSTDSEKRDSADRSRDEVAKATERAKPELQKAGRELKEGAKTAAEQAYAAAQGVKEGWERGGHRAIDVNSASEDDLQALSGITKRDARRIIAARPYSDPRQLVTKGILSRDRYADLRTHLTAN